MMDFVVQTTEGAPPDAQPVEVVERKGIGHPDTLCDALAEQISIRLCRAYQERFGEILHHNVDKVLLRGGRAAPAFGGGEVLEPMELYLAGRAVDELGGVNVPVDELAVEACHLWLRATLHALDPDRHVRLFPRFHRGSTDLVGLFGRGRKGGAPLANDTSCGVGYAPLTELERVVLEVERHLNSAQVKGERPETGEDVKVMGIRRDGRVSLTVGCALIGRFVVDASDYARKKAAVVKEVQKAARAVTEMPVDVTVNAADDMERGQLYLTVTGTSAEGGDDGEAGRGNRANGLITPYRPMTLEAAAGKNPVSHVGKLYNLAAGRIAAAVVGVLPEVLEASCFLVSRIGHPIDEPQLAHVRVHTRGGRSPAGLTERVQQLVREELSGLGALREELLSGRLAVY